MMQVLIVTALCYTAFSLIPVEYVLFAGEEEVIPQTFSQTDKELILH